MAIYLTIKLSGWRKLYAIPFFIFGFLGYFSAKTLLIPLVVISTCASKLFNKKGPIKPLILVNITIVFFVLAYGLILAKTPAGARIKELKSHNIAQVVNMKRTESITSPLSVIFENKVVEDLRSRLTASLGELNANYLFLNSQPENTPSLSIPDHSFMYFVDLFFVLTGLTYLLKKYPKQLIFLLGLVGTTFIPNFLNLQGTTFSIRTVVLFPILAIISGVGVYSIYEFVKKRNLQTAYLVCVAILYITLFLNFIWIYFYRMPIERSEGWFFSQRVLSNYVKLLETKQPKTKIILTALEPKHAFYRYLFYTNNYLGNQEVAALNEKMAKTNYQINNLTITSLCPTHYTDKDTIYITDTNSKCDIEKSNTSIRSIKDSGDRYFISEDKLCDPELKKEYPLIKDLQTLNVESLSLHNFCLNYISEN